MERKDLDETKVIGVANYPSFTAFTCLNVVLLFLTVLIGSAFIVVGNFLVAFGSSKVWSQSNHFVTDIDTLIVCIFGFITIWKRRNTFMVDTYCILLGATLISQFISGMIVNGFHIAVLVEFGQTLSNFLKIGICATMVLNISRYGILMALFFVAYDLSKKIRQFASTASLPNEFEPKPKGRIFLPPGPARYIYVRPYKVEDSENSQHGDGDQMIKSKSYP